MACSSASAQRLVYYVMNRGGSQWLPPPSGQVIVKVADWSTSYGDLSFLSSCTM